MPGPNDIPTNSRSERFVIGFIFGALSGFFGVLLYGSPIAEAFAAALFFGAIVGGLGAIFGQRVFQFLIDLITRFG